MHQFGIDLGVDTETVLGCFHFVVVTETVVICTIVTYFENVLFIILSNATT